MKLCANQFKTEINPDTAAEILILADRHCLKSLKQVLLMYNRCLKKDKFTSPFVENWTEGPNNQLSSRISLFGKHCLNNINKVAKTFTD